jgi:chemotaxis protein CheC
VGPTFTEPQKRILAAIFERGAEEASRSLSTWLGQPARLTVSEVDEVDLAEAADLLGPEDELVAACVLGLSGRFSGHLLLVFGDRSGLALADLLLRQPVGTSTAWGELERSAAMETANIVGCAYLNSLSAHLPAPHGAPASLLPSPPTFRHEFAGSLLEFALMEQAIRLDRLLLARTQFESEQMELDWTLLLVPDGESLESIALTLSEPGTP